MTRLWLILYIPFALVVLALSVVAFAVIAAWGSTVYRAWTMYLQSVGQVASALFLRGLDMWEGGQ